MAGNSVDEDRCRSQTPYNDVQGQAGATMHAGNRRILESAKSKIVGYIASERYINQVSLLVVQQRRETGQFCCRSTCKEGVILLN
jgi:hypothetical protein